MTQQVLARKFRPQQFQDLIGQESLVTALQNALTQKRLHHAYLFTGTRGVGKTTTARILAKALSCEQGVVANPCDQCKHCTAINNGSFIDLFEIDAASHTKVDETKEIINKAMYPPSQGPYRIFIIDEVHMLSKHSFNALLKTLEEPPEFVQFILATTNPEKLPNTILSRCLHFNLAALSNQRIEQQLAKVLEQEHITFAAEALSLIAKSAKGSMRDALSLTEPMISMAGDDPITAEVASRALGLAADETIEALLTAINQQDAAQVMQIIASLSDANIDIKTCLEQLASTLHKLTIAKYIPSTPLSHSLESISKNYTAQQLQLQYEITIKGLTQLPHTPTARQCLEVVCLRQMAFHLDKTPTQPILQAITTNTTITAPVSNSTVQPVDKTPKTSQNPSVAFTQTAPTLNTPASALPSQTTTSIQPTGDIHHLTADNWAHTTSQLGCSGMTLALLQNTEFDSFDTSSAVLTLKIAKNKAAMLNTTQTQRIEKALYNYLNTHIKLHVKTDTHTENTPIQQAEIQQKVKHDATRSALLADDNVQSIMQQFDAKLTKVTASE